MPLSSLKNEAQSWSRKKELDDPTLRPESLSEFIGQKTLLENLQVFLKAAELRSEALEHILFWGPPGLGKTTLARIIAQFQKGRFIEIGAPNLSRPGDLVKILAGLSKNDILFIDEIHRLPTNVEEVLYSAMEDAEIDFSLQDVDLTQSIRLKLPPFTLVGATTQSGKLSSPFRDRFGIQLRLSFYNHEEIYQILLRACNKLEINYEDSAVTEIAYRSRKTPRIALALLRRVLDFSTVDAHQKDKELKLTQSVAKLTFQRLEIDDLGLTELDREYLKAIINRYQGGPVGLKPLSALLAEDSTNLEEFVEPFLFQAGLIERTPRGRVVSEQSYTHLNLSVLNRAIKKNLEFFE